MTPTTLSLDLSEHTDLRVPAEAVSDDDATLLRDAYATQITVEPPTLWNGRNWVFRPNGYVGFIPVSERLALRLNPKVPLLTVFGMLEWAYQLDPQWLRGLFETGSLAEFYERLASILARRVLDRARKGLYRRYVPQNDRLAYVRGAIDLRDRIRRPWAPTLLCDFQEHSADVAENQILAWTLFTIARSGLCSEQLHSMVRRAFHTVEGGCSLTPFRGRDCVRRTYDRLSEDYRPMHALCRFFLEHAGARHTRGEHRMLPFLVNMNTLFESFVAEWLREHLPSHLKLTAQDRMTIGDHDELMFKVDMVIRETTTMRPVLLLDTKYKAPELPAPADVSQVVTYAEAIGCRQAALVYPTKLARPVHAQVGDIRVRSLTCDLSGDLEAGGQALLREVLAMAERGAEQIASGSSSGSHV